MYVENIVLDVVKCVSLKLNQFDIDLNNIVNKLRSET